MNSRMKSLIAVLILMTATSICLADELFKDIKGNTISFSSLKGKWILINYWAGWCTTCVDEIPELNVFYRKHLNDPVALFAVNYDGLPLYHQKRLIKKLHILYPSLRGDPAFALGLGDIMGIPVTFIINPEGKLVKRLYGGQSAKELDAALERI